MSGPAGALVRAGQRERCAPHARFRLGPDAWAALPAALAAEPSLALLGLWAEPGLVHAALLDEAEGEVLLASVAAPEGRYAALSPARPGAIRFERMIRDLWGLEAEGAVDLRPWLDHGAWGVAAPLGRPARRAEGAAPQPAFLPAEGDGVHQIAVGPIHAGVIEPGHFRFHVQGEAVVRLEARLGYVHKGTIGLMLGKPPRFAARFAARLSGDSTVAHSWGFAMAVEAAAGCTPPPRAIALRAVMAEIERAANHLNDIGFLCNDAAFAWPHARCGLLREALLRAAQQGFGHRLMMDRVVPGGVTEDLGGEGASAIAAATSRIAAELPGIVAVIDGHASLQDRLVGTGILAAALAARFAAGGPVGRASGRGFDARRLPGYAPYTGLDFAVPVLPTGDVEARLRVRIEELRASLGLIERLLARLPEGPISAPVAARGGEGVGLIEAFRGEALHWVALDDGGLVRAAFARDAAWAHWPLLEAAIEGNIVADFPLINKSFNGSYSGVDL